MSDYEGRSVMSCSVDNNLDAFLSPQLAQLVSDPFKPEVLHRAIMTHN